MINGCFDESAAGGEAGYLMRIFMRRNKGRDQLHPIKSPLFQGLHCKA
jgi:hypothetical protein